MKSHNELILSARHFEELVPYLSSADIETVSLALWRLQFIDDHRGSDLLISIWEKDNNSIIDQKIIDNKYLLLGICSALIQFGYYFYNDCEDYIYHNIKSDDVYIRAKAAESLSAVGTIKAVRLLRVIVEEDNEAVGYKALNSLGSIALQHKRINSNAAALLSQEIIGGLENRIDPEKKILQKYLNELLHKIESNAPRIEDDSYRPVFTSQLVYPRTYRLLLPYAEDGDQHAMYEIGQMYFSGYSVDKNTFKGHEILLKLAKLGNIQAINDLSYRHRVGDGLKKDLHLATMYLKKAADLGDKDAQIKLREIYLEQQHYENGANSNRGQTAISQ